MGRDGRERETGINDKGVGHHGNRHTTTLHGSAEEEAEEEKEREILYHAKGPALF